MNLTSAARVTQYLGPSNPTTAYTAALTALLPRASRAVENFCNRSFARTAHAAAKLNGSGSAVQRIPDWPVLSVESLYLLGNPVAVPVSADGLAYGYQFDDKYLYLTGAVFPQGMRTVTLGYTSGFTDTQTDFIPAAPGPYTLGAPDDGYASEDLGVTNYATGAAFVLVGSAPATGQYTFADGVWTFAAADTGVRVTRAFSYVPGDVEQACIEVIGTELQQRSQLGLRSKGLAGESTTFETLAMPRVAADKLYNYRKVVPV